LNDVAEVPVAMNTAGEFRLSFKGSVNRWECDENDHLNVRFYSRMAFEALANYVAETGIRNPVRLLNQHMRYIAEARLATPISGFVMRVGVRGALLRHLIELRHSFTGQVLATFLADSDHGSPGLRDEADRALPAHAGPRGLAATESPFAVLQRDEAAAHGFVLTGKGVVARSECGADDTLPAHALMGRMSDAMPNLWAVLQSAEEQAARSNGFQGGAVLEYRKTYHFDLKAADRYEVWSGVRDVSAKLQHFVHLVFELEHGRCVTSGEALAVVLDLVARRAIEVPAARKARMLGLRVRLPSDE
jgi:acyl-CoA thioester hydrolase